jgi:hypothetical protein
LVLPVPLTGGCLGSPYRDSIPFVVVYRFHCAASSVTVDSITIIPYILETLNNFPSRCCFAYRTNLPGADDLYMSTIPLQLFSMRNSPGCQSRCQLSQRYSYGRASDEVRQFRVVLLCLAEQLSQSKVLWNTT